MYFKSFIPTALLSCVFKTFERMVKLILEHYLESNLVDCIVSLILEIEIFFAEKELLVSLVVVNIIRKSQNVWSTEGLATYKRIVH